MKLVTLTPRQFEVAKLLSHGLTYKEVGSQLGISERTVEFHVRALRRVTGSRTTVAAVSRARGRAASAHARTT